MLGAVGMKKIGIVVAGIIALWVGWSMFTSSTWRYRLTLEVETPEGTKTGSSVREVTVTSASKLDVDMTGHAYVSGEAVAVDLGQRGVLFALMNRGAQVDNGIYIVIEAFPWSKGIGNVYYPDARAYYDKLRAKTDVPLSKLPTLVRFRDINDPKTVELVDPNDLAKGFGAGVALKSATIEMVDDGIHPLSNLGITGEPMTTGIEDSLPWWNIRQPWMKELNGGVFVDTRPADEFKVNKDDFVKGK